MEKNEAKGPTTVTAQTLAVLRERWNDPDAAKKDPLLLNHVRLDVDELIGYYLFYYAFTWRIRTAYDAVGRAIDEFLKKGTDKTNGPFLFWGMGPDQLPDGHMAEEWARKNVYGVGVLGGEFDEHTPNGRMDGACAATLVAKKLGIAGDPALQKLLKYALRCDTTPSGGIGDIAGAVKLMTRDGNTMPFREVLRWAFAYFATIVDEQQEKFTATPAMYHGNATETKIAGSYGHGAELTVALIKNATSPQLVQYAFGRGIAFVVMQSPRGNVFFHWNPAFGKPDLEDLVVAVRVEELKTNGKSIPSERAELAKTGKVNGAECWFYSEFAPEQRTKFLNGTLTAPDTPPTKIPIERIMEIVETVFNKQKWPPGFAVFCRQGECACRSPKMLRRECPFFPLRLPRCISVQAGERRLVRQEAEPPRPAPVAIASQPQS